MKGHPSRQSVSAARMINSVSSQVAVSMRREVPLPVAIAAIVCTVIAVVAVFYFLTGTSKRRAAEIERIIQAGVIKGPSMPKASSGNPPAAPVTGEATTPTR